MDTPILTEDVIKTLEDGFSVLKDDVSIKIFTKKSQNDKFNDFTVNLINELKAIAPKIKPEFFKLGSDEAKRYNIEMSPTILLAPDTYNIRYMGAPIGEEGRSFITALILLSTGKQLLSEDSIKRLERLKEKRRVRIFVSPT